MPAKRRKIDKKTRAKSVEKLLDQTEREISPKKDQTASHVSVDSSLSTPKVSPFKRVTRSGTQKPSETVDKAINDEANTPILRQRTINISKKPTGLSKALKDRSEDDTSLIDEGKVGKGIIEKNSISQSRLNLSKDLKKRSITKSISTEAKLRSPNDTMNPTILSELLDRLKNIRETEPEKLLREYKLNAQNRFKASDDLIEKLQTEVNRLNSEIQATILRNDFKQSVETGGQFNITNVDGAIPSTLNRLEYSNINDFDGTPNLSLELELLRGISGVSVQQIQNSDGIISLHCIQKGNKGIFRYTLSLKNGLDSEDQDLTFVPYLNPQEDEELIKYLPTYFTEPLSFQRKAVSI